MSAAQVFPFPSGGRTPRQILREWMQTVTGEGTEYDVAELKARAVRRFADDREMQEACLVYAVSDLMPQVMGQEFRRLRDEAQRDFDDAIAKKLARWYVHVGNGRHKSLLAATRDDLAADIAEREGVVVGHRLVIEFETDLFSGLTNKKQTVRQRFSDEEIATVWRRHFDHTDES
jgi:hypothetical protein